jgi:diguanylate cyclase (GGDEF)-like protein
VATKELPLTSDTIYSEIQRDLLRPVFISSLMASDTFLRDWVLQGEKDPEEIRRYLQEIKERYHAFTAFFVSDKTLKYYHLNGVLKTVEPDVPRDAWYFRVSRMYDPYEINVDFDMANNDTLTVFVNYRVFDYQGRFIGVTGVGLSLDAVLALIKRYKETYTRDILFVDKAGEITLSSIDSKKYPQHLTSLVQILKSGNLDQYIEAKENNSFDIGTGDSRLIINTRYINEFDWNLLVIQRGLEGSEALWETLLLNLAACLLITIFVLIMTHRTISSYQQEVADLAIKDRLTGLFNRHGFDILMQQVIVDAKRQPQDVSLILFDLDYFKQINDDLGHLAGDDVLQHIAGTLRSRLREADIFCRWGGEEFIILLKRCNLKTAASLASELRLALMNNPCQSEHVVGQEITIKASFGVTQFRPGESKVEWLARADKALYKAKSAGRNQVVSL